MKKAYFFSFAALAMMASCSNDAEVDMPAGNAIAFTNTFVNHASRAAEPLTTENILDFGVFGFIQDMNGIVFDGEKVYRTDAGSAWQYDNTQYWSANKQYWFAAVAPYASESLYSAPAAMPTGTGEVQYGSITGFTNNGQTDLLFAQTLAKGMASGNVPVAFTFNHLLSKVRFTFTNGWSNTNTTLVVSNLKITDAYANGDAQLSSTGTVWTSSEPTLSLSFTTSGSKLETVKADPNAKEVSGINFMIPAADKAYTVKFDLAWYNGDVLSRVYHKQLTIPAMTMNPGYGYNFTCELTKENVAEDLEPIVFTVTEVNTFEEQPDIPYPAE